MMFLSANQCKAKDAYSVLRTPFFFMHHVPSPPQVWPRILLVATFVARQRANGVVEASLGIEPLPFVSHPLFPRVEYGIVTTETFPRHLTVLETAS
jgi:hypothetical protein